MGQTIQAFVDKIKAEGISAAETKAEEILAEAKTKAEEVLRQASQEKDRILAGAQSEAENLMSRSQTQLKLAARDAVLRLRDALNRALEGLLAGAAAEKLADPDFVGKVLHEIVVQYGKAEIAGKKNFRVNVPEAMHQQFVDWAIAHLGVKEEGGDRMGIDLKGTLQQVGFEFSMTGATVEVTTESVVEVLSELVSPTLREVLDKSLVDGAQDEADGGE